jgi:hypothetical protein
VSQKNKSKTAPFAKPAKSAAPGKPRKKRGTQENGKSKKEPTLAKTARMGHRQCDMHLISGMFVAS